MQQKAKVKSEGFRKCQDTQINDTLHNKYNIVFEKCVYECACKKVLVSLSMNV
jgi:hypothetical protein